MVGLTGGMTAAADYARDCGHHITHVLLDADNTAALGETDKTGALAQVLACCYSFFCRQIQQGHPRVGSRVLRRLGQWGRGPNSEGRRHAP
jgi:hypothetical protein